MHWCLVQLVFIATLQSAVSFSTSPFDDSSRKDVCSSLTPTDNGQEVHGSTPQSNPAPYEITFTPSATNFYPGQQYTGW